MTGTPFQARRARNARRGRKDSTRQRPQAARTKSPRNRQPPGTPQPTAREGRDPPRGDGPQTTPARAARPRRKAKTARPRTRKGRDNTGNTPKAGSGRKPGTEARPARAPPTKRPSASPEAGDRPTKKASPAAFFCGAGGGAGPTNTSPQVCSARRPGRASAGRYNERTGGPTDALPSALDGLLGGIAFEGAAAPARLPDGCCFV